jgi:hypothetical protein
MASTRPAALWRYPLRALGDVLVMGLALVLATWPLLALFVVLKILL